MRASLAILVALVGASSPCSAQPKSGTQREPVVRAPFVLKLRIDKGHFYEERFGKVPYVAGDDVYLFAGDSFGINIISAHGRIPRISYQPDPARADLEFSFSQQRGAGGFEMMLVIQNKLKCKLYLDALMTVPGKKGVYETDILPVPPNLSDYESWPHPIVQLVLRNFRFSENGPKDSDGQR
ncbi:MAG: hypothetical protein ACRD4C_12075 [Candidatus Acidiferrales bacterium]